MATSTWRRPIIVEFLTLDLWFLMWNHVLYPRPSRMTSMQANISFGFLYESFTSLFGIDSLLHRH